MVAVEIRISILVTRQAFDLNGVDFALKFFFLLYGNQLMQE